MSGGGARVAGGIVLVLVVVLVIAAAARSPLPLPVTIDLSGPGTVGIAGRVRLAEVTGRVAVLVPAALAGIGLMVAPRVPLLVIDLAAAPIVVFVVAQLNGITDVGALVLTYAATAGAVLMRLLHTGFRQGRPLPLRFAAMLGIVPWGVIALHQVGEIVAGTDPGPGVRVTTVAVLAATILEFVLAWRGRRRSARVLLTAAPGVLLALLGVLAIP